MPILKRNQYPDGLVIIEWNLPRGCFTVFGILGLIGSVALSAIKTNSPEINIMLLQTCKCLVVPTMVVLSGLALNTGLGGVEKNCSHCKKINFWYK